jgi:hypothetical protein
MMRISLGKDEWAMRQIGGKFVKSRLRPRGMRDCYLVGKALGEIRESLICASQSFDKKDIEGAGKALFSASTTAVDMGIASRIPEGASELRAIKQMGRALGRALEPYERGEKTLTPADTAQLGEAIRGLRMRASKLESIGADRCTWAEPRKTAARKAPKRKP